MSITLQGRKVATAAELERPGDFCFWHVSPDGQFAYMAFICPCGAAHTPKHDSIPVKQGEKQEHSWAWDGNHDQPTLSPSIHRTGDCGWHGYLRNGVWSTA